MNERVRNYLINVAQRSETVTYQDLCRDCDLDLDMYGSPSDRSEVGHIIGEISIYEHKYGRPLLSALVLTSQNEQGDGFYKMCEELGLIGDWKRAKREEVFGFSEIKKCYEYWQ